MSLQVFLPGLVWPSDQARGLTEGLQLPALSALLGHARVSTGPGANPDSRLAATFGLGEPLPHAALRRQGEASLPPVPAGRFLLNADPVHLHFAREHLLLADAASHRINADEAHTLVAALNEVFADVGHFECGAPDRWYLQLEQPAEADFFPLGDVVGRPIATFLPEGPRQRDWQRLMNEAQIVLHNHPLNQAREERGLPTINSIWLWGAGAAPARLQPPATRLQASEPFARGLAAAAGLPCSAPGADLDDSTLLVRDELLGPARYLDIHAWRDALAALEADCFAPLLAALRARRVRHLTLIAPGDRLSLQLDVAASRMWQFWRRPRSLDDLLKSLR